MRVERLKDSPCGHLTVEWKTPLLLCGVETLRAYPLARPAHYPIAEVPSALAANYF
jgi:hypothetical protein